MIRGDIFNWLLHTLIWHAYILETQLPIHGNELDNGNGEYSFVVLLLQV